MKLILLGTICIVNGIYPLLATINNLKETKEVSPLLILIIIYSFVCLGIGIYGVVQGAQA